MWLTPGSSQFSEGGSGDMVLRDEKERIRLARLSRSIREETKCYIYRSKLQTSEGEPEINDANVYLGLTSCNKVEACGICLDSECLDRFEEYLTHEEQVEFKHCLISSDSRTFEKYQVEVAKMIREREDVVQRMIEKQIAERKRKTELEEKAKIEEEVHKVMNERVDDFTKGELLEILNGTEKGQRLIAERKARLDEEMRNAVEMGKAVVNTESVENGSTRSDGTESEQKLETQKVPYIGCGKLHVFIHSFANIKEAEFMDGLFVRLTIVDGNGLPKESVKCFPNKLNGDGVDRGMMLVFRTGTTLTTVLDSLEPGAFIVIELLHYKKQQQSLKCWSFMDIQSLLTPISDTLNLCLLQKPVHLKNIMRELRKQRELKHSEDGKFITSINPYGNKANLDLMVSFKIV